MKLLLKTIEISNQFVWLGSYLLRINGTYENETLQWNAASQLLLMHKNAMLELNLFPVHKNH